MGFLESLECYEIVLDIEPEHSGPEPFLDVSIPVTFCVFCRTPRCNCFSLVMITWTALFLAALTIFVFFQVDTNSHERLPSVPRLVNHAAPSNITTVRAWTQDL